MQEIVPHLPMMARVAQAKAPRDWEDVLQNAVVAAIEALQAGRYVETGSLAAWLGTITRNEAWEFYHRRKRPRPVSDHSDDAAHFIDTHLGSTPAPQDSIIALHQAIAKINAMKPCFRDAMLGVLAGLDGEEIAARMGVSLGTMKSRIFRGRKMLSEAFE